MNVTLPRELEEFILKKAASGAYPSTDAVVIEALREFQRTAEDERQSEWMRPLPDGSCPPELKTLLLEAVRGPHHPMPSDYFEQLRQRLRGLSAR
jgi:Arc/MetJ-type ribon-helix-helix transcriptional regulator